MDETQKMNATNDDAPCPHCIEYLAGWKRAQADYANLKKETERARDEWMHFSHASLLIKLIPAIDQFDAALVHAPASIPEDWMKGLHAVKSIWDKAAAEIGVKKIPTDAAFDPTIHEAISEEGTTEKNEGEILSVVQNGWMLNDKLLYPAKVIISKAK
ncbi:MAG: nucleotide exchange factor GrpE [Patescibacteria group bacterium]